ncbi:methyltransferase [Amycolatopsis sp. NPDC049688]|uniref:methyltransferase n=1 Tax=Amycolatopsis sp. NPDC049688 TaxID=3154733 RepID=UPI00342E44F5
MTNTDLTLPEAVVRVRELMLSAAYAAALRAAVKLGLPDAIGGEPVAPAALAAAVGADAGALHRLVRALAAFGVFTIDSEGCYRHTELSRLLREDAPHSVKYNVLWSTEPWTWDVWPRLDDAVRTGGSVFGSLHGTEFFDYLHREAPESAEVFDRAMTQSSRLSAHAVAEALDLTSVATVADIAGGQGLVLATLLERHPELHGVLLDLPGVLAGADARLREGGSLAGRARLVPGDCRAAIPVRADVYLLKNILEWDDESTLRTLRNVIAAAGPGARVVVIENLVDDSPEMSFTTAMDLLLLLNVGGRKQTKDELVALVQQAGLRVEAVRAVNSYLHMVECVV